MHRRPGHILLVRPVALSLLTKEAKLVLEHFLVSFQNNFQEVSPASVHPAFVVVFIRTCGFWRSYIDYYWQYVLHLQSLCSTLQIRNLKSQVSYLYSEVVALAFSLAKKQSPIFDLIDHYFLLPHALHCNSYMYFLECLYKLSLCPTPL